MMEFENPEVGEKMSWKGFVSKLIEPDALGSVRSDLKKLDFFSSETSKNHLIRNILRNGRVRVKIN